jgi:hypothetical protein
MNPLVREQLAAWARRYRMVAAGTAAFLVLVVALPSVAPPLDDADPSPTRFAAAAPPAPSGLLGATASPVPAGASPFRTPSLVAPVLDAPLADGADDAPPAPGPPDPVPPPGHDVACPAPLPPPEREPEPVPLAEILNLAGPVLPLLGPFVPFGLAGLPLVEPALPVVTPFLPLGEPVYVFIGPLFARIGGPLSEVSALVIQPVDEAMAPYLPQMLESEKAFVAMLQPVIDQAVATGAFRCGAILTASLAGAVAEYLTQPSATGR